MSNTAVPNSGGAGGSAPGGAGSNGATFITGGSGGGGGAHGYSGSTLPIGTSVTGGAGGTGGTGGNPAAGSHTSGYGGGGGGGGFGAVVEGNGALGSLAGNLTGGTGGSGGATTPYGYNNAGAGGAGGGGLYLTSSASTSLTVASTVQGGSGGAGGIAGGTVAVDGFGGAGGSAIFATNTGAITTLTLTNQARVLGGNGGTGGWTGDGGIGIAGENLTLILSAGAQVAGGLSGDALTRNHAIQFLGGTNVLELQGNGGTSGQTYAAITGDVLAVGNTTLRLSGAGGVFDLSKLSGTGFSGFSGLTVATTGTWIVSGTASETVPVTVASGTLSNSPTGATGATLSGDITIANGAHLGAHAVAGSSAFTINGDLSLSGATSSLDVTLGAPSATPLITVNGNLTLNGVLNVSSSDTAPIEPGTFSLINYSGTGLTVNAASDDYNYDLSTSTANLVTLTVLPNGLYWNGSTTSGNHTVAGGSGTWTADTGVTNWLDPTLTFYVSSDPSQKAFFTASAGTVTVDNSAGAVSSTGLIFNTTGYVLTGAQASDTLTLTSSTSAAPRVNVAGSDTVATIALPLAGTQGMEKDGAGRLILTGVNTYTGGTTISAGTLQLGNGTTSGSVLGNITNNAALVFNPAGLTSTYAGTISGSGTVEKTGTGWQTLSGNNSYTGATMVSDGLLLVSSNNALGSTAGRTVVSSGATLGLYGTGLTIAEPLTLSGFGIGGVTGALTSYRGLSTGAGTNTVSGAITLAADASIVNSGGAGDVLNLTGNITGDGKSLYLGSTTGATNTVSGRINTGSGGVGIASGTWKFSGINGYTGSTFIAAGARLILDAASGNAISGNIVNNGTLAIINEDLNGIISGSGNIEVGSNSGLNFNYINGTNTYTGQTSISSGYLTISNARSLGSAVGGTTVSNGGVLYIDMPSGNNVMDEPLTLSGFGYYGVDEAAVTIRSGALTYTGSITVAGDTKIHVWDAASVDFKGGINGSGKTLMLSANSTATNKRTVSGVIALGSGGVKVRGGEWLFTAQNTYTGVTTVGEDGFFTKLRNNGRIAGDVVVNNLATYGGSGQSGSVTVRNGGRIAPGNSPGTLTVAGNLTMESGSIYEAEVSPPAHTTC